MEGPQELPKEGLGSRDSRKQERHFGTQKGQGQSTRSNTANSTAEVSPGAESSAPEARRTKGPGKLAGHSTWSPDLLLQTRQAREGLQTVRGALSD